MNAIYPQCKQNAAKWLKFSRDKTPKPHIVMLKYIPFQNVSIYIAHYMNLQLLSEKQPMKMIDVEDMYRIIVERQRYFIQEIVWQW